MSLLKPFLLSSALHLLIIAAAWGIFKAALSYTEPQKESRIALRLDVPQSVESKPAPVIPPKPPIAPQTPAKILPASRQNTVLRPMQPAVSPVIPITPKSQPTSASTAVLTPEPAAVKAASAEPVIVKTAPPPAAVDIQAQFEEENLAQIRTLLMQRLKYPKNALRLKQQGDIVVTFTLSPSGDISALVITKSSEYEILDEAARSLILSTAPVFPKPAKNVRISVPIDYKIR